MSYKHLALPLLTLSLLAFPTLSTAEDAALEPMVVTATRTPTPLSQLGSSVTLITADDIERRQFQTLTDALKDVPGLMVVQSGVMGSQTSVFMRGTNSDHVLVLIDGVEMNDPSSPNGSFDFAHFLLDDIDSIEIVRGSQSVLYGADAIGGVIQIRTITGEGPVKIRGKVEVGMNSTHHETVAISGSEGDFDYSLTMGLLKTEGESIATEKRQSPFATEFDNDGYDNQVLSTKLGWTPSERFATHFSARYIKTETDIDAGFDFFGNTLEDEDAKNYSDQLYLAADAIGHFFDDRWQAIVAVSRADIERKNRNDRQDPFGTLERTDYEGIKDKFSLQNDFSFLANNLITLGFEYEDEEMTGEGFTDFGGFIIDQQSDADRQTKSAYLQDQFNINDQLFATVGIRYDEPDDFDAETTYRATANYALTQNTHLRGAYGTGFKAPSLFQLYGYTPNNFFSAYYGNPDLKSETSKGWEIGFDQTFWNDNAIANITYYKTEVDDLISTEFLPSFDSTTINHDKVDLKGLETSLLIAATTDIDVNLSYTYTHTRDENDQELLRRPKNKASIDIAFQATKKMTLSTSALYTGSRKDVDGFGQRIDMGGYTIFNVAVNYELTDTVRIFTRIDNLGNKTYEPAYGYQALGMAGYIGLEISNR